MSSVALLLGLFAVPAFLMILGHRLRGRTKAHKQRFWGGVYGYVLGMGLAVTAMVVPAVAWDPVLGLRAGLVHWAMVVGGVIGVLTGPFWAGPPRPRR